MKKVVFVLIFLVLVSISFADAFSANVTVIDEIGSFSGAVLRVKSPITQELGDKIYPSENKASVGVVKFEIETSLSEVFLNVILSKNGMIVANNDEGPFVVNGSGILIDRRPEVVIEVIDEVIEANESVNESVVVVESEEVDEESSLVDVTGRAIGGGWAGSNYLWGGIIFFFLLGGLLFIIKKRGRKSKDNMSEDDKELEYMEKKVKDTEGKIGKIKDDRSKKDRIEKTKEKLVREEAELRDLEGPKDSEKEDDVL